MSSDIAIKVDNLSKCYQIYDRPQDRLKQMLMRGRKQYYRDFWALKDVSFEIKKGETVGIIGRNGSGKSTLLQMICGTLNPTSGSVQTNGRIAALLELGSGFNPEFTGRENVYLNATLLGLTKEEINQRFDTIAAFAEIGEFIDQPVKTYSSGMYVRLAFAVIAHVNADILVVDEALSVGDAVFTQKCMRFIREFQERGTLIFVSHDMGSVQNLCESAIWLGQGQIKLRGSSKDVAEAYLQYTLQEVYGNAVQLKASAKITASTGDESSLAIAKTLAVDYASRFSVKDNLHAAGGWKSGAAEVTGVTLENLSGSSQVLFEGGERVCMRIRAKADEHLANPILGFLVKDRLGQDLFGENTLPVSAVKLCSVAAGEEFEGEFVFMLPMLPNGQYVVMASVADGDLHSNTQHHYLHDAMVINVSSSKVRWGLVGVPFERITLKVTK
jgi:lipopolysaccharide transport system ATP-binding protein